MKAVRLGCALLLSAAAGIAVAAPRHITPCVDGQAGGFACHRVDLMAQMDLTALSAGGGNDIWGWTDPDSGIEYALVGLNNGTAFVSLEQPDHPVLIGKLPTQSSNSLWRDIKVYDNHAFIVSEAGDHGMQVFDLTRLRDVATPPVTFTADTVYTQFGRAHNIAINEDSGFAYAVGSRQGTQQCNAGLHMVDINTPASPQFAGCFSADGYTHDTQCVIYSGPDAEHAGREICFSSNEDTLTITDVTDKSSPVQISRTPYAGSAYSHQGWLTPDQRWFLMDDELDEMNFGHNTRTYFWDVSDIDAPVQAFNYTGPVASTDHNLYTRDHYAFLSNYRSGLRILDLSGIDQQQIEEVAFFDTYPEADSTGFDGAWSNYPYFESGIVVIGDINRGLFVLKPQLCTSPEAPAAPTAAPAGDNQIDLSWTGGGEPGVTYEVWRELGGCGTGPGERIASGLTSASFSDIGVSGQVDFGYRIRTISPSGECQSAYSACSSAQTTGACTAPPQFDGLASLATATSGVCRLDLDWSPAAASCGGALAYDVHRSTDPEFVPDAGNLIAGDLAATDYGDDAVQPDTEYTYVVRSRDQGNGAGDGNLVRLSAMPLGAVADGEWITGAESGDPILNGDGGGNPTRHVAWHVVDDMANSGQRSYYSGYVNAECVALTTGALDITPGQTAQLSFHTRYGIEDGWDGGVVQISGDGGDSWQTLTPTGGYPGAIANAGNACGLPVGAGVFDGTALTWHEVQVPLTGHGGSVQLRWLFTTDTKVSEEGWWLDDIVVEHVQVAGQCVAADDLLFADGFEQR